jgi:large subunit ribosomal protein L23
VQVLEVLVRPVVTEKSTLLQEQGKYVFEVLPSANKSMVREAVERAFDVNVVSVNMLKTRGKMKRFGPRQVRTRDIKKAVVTLKAGDRIQIFEGA